MKPVAGISRINLVGLILLTLTIYCSSDQSFFFEAPKTLNTGNTPIHTQEPGYAAPCIFDLDGDGTVELLVGQFRGGKIAIYTHKQGLEFGAATWLKANEKVAKIPGVT